MLNPVVLEGSSEIPVPGCWQPLIAFSLAKKRRMSMSKAIQERMEGGEKEY